MTYIQSKRLSADKHSQSTELMQDTIEVYNFLHAKISVLVS